MTKYRLHYSKYKRLKNQFGFEKYGTRSHLILRQAQHER